MDSCHFWHENCFHILFYDSTPPYVERINVKNQELVMITSVQHAYSTMVLFLPDSTLTFPTMWMNILIWIHMIGVSIGSIIFNCLLGTDIFRVEFT
jgi:hypothetical protein